MKNRPSGSKICIVIARLFPVRPVHSPSQEVFIRRKDFAMSTHKPSRHGIFLIFAVLGFSTTIATAQNYSISAVDVVMPAVGNATSQYTVIAVPSTGTLTISCSSAAPIASTTKAPVCFAGIPHAIPVVAGQTVTGTILFVPYGTALPGIVPAAAAMIMIGFAALRRRRRLTAITFAAIAAGLAPLSSCGGTSNGMTPGTYQFTVSAVNNPAAGGSTSYLAQTTVTVKVP